LLLDAFESLLAQWRRAGAVVTRMATVHAEALRRTPAARPVTLGEIPGRSGVLAMPSAVVAAHA
jgi:hypothetical protein